MLNKHLNTNLNTNRKAARKLLHAAHAISIPYDAEAAGIISRAMDAVDNERLRLLRARKAAR